MKRIRYLFLEYLPIRTRILGWFLFQKQIPGFLRWSYNYWLSCDQMGILYSRASNAGKPVLNPWDDTTSNRWSPGDAMLVYPPRDRAMGNAIIGSIRWELIRESYEDYEYLKMTAELAAQGDAEARSILDCVAKQVVPDWRTHTRDDRLLEAVRLRMGNLLSRHQPPERVANRRPPLGNKQKGRRAPRRPLHEPQEQP
jgi:hypothetical protein